MQSELFNHRLEQELKYYLGKFLNPSDRRRDIKGRIVIEIEHSKPVRFVFESEAGFRDEIDLDK